MQINSFVLASLLAALTLSVDASEATKATLIRESCDVAREFQLSVRRLPDEIDQTADPIELRLIVDISKEGRVTGSRVASSNVGRRIIRSMQSAVRSCSFAPARHDQVPVDGTAEVALRLYVNSFPVAGVALCPFAEPPRGVRLPSEVVFTSLRIFIDSDARPLKVEIQQSSGVPALDEAAQLAMMKCKPLPEAERSGVEVPFIDINYEWR